MRKIFTTILLLLIFVSAYSQEFKLRMQTGIGTYSMIGLKNINEFIINGLPFDTKQISNFPAYWYYSPSLLVHINEFSIGPIYSFQSTGSRISGKDYSGEYRFDMKVKSSSIGIYAQFDLWSQQKSTLSLYSTLSAMFSGLELSEYFNVSDSTLSNSQASLKSLNYSFEPGVNYTFSVLKQLSLGANLGYLVPFGKQAFYMGSDKNNTLYDAKKQEPVQPEWNGIRLGISVCYTLNHKKTKTKK